ncbi:hypothetical protein CALCODRAFT_25176 [Calocera cornea HHB12733]|uniref:Uncharacterized protein n=1 Tax=Calocera cornea HHB12733 TaxID=1353952 RepID=A0A165J2B6_9BASI|nr:hypothetical protein CALCODRAFT_25176 [Calocera cornea HHB12733]
MLRRGVLLGALQRARRSLAASASSTTTRIRQPPLPPRRAYSDASPSPADAAPAHDNAAPPVPAPSQPLLNSILQKLLEGDQPKSRHDAAKLPARVLRLSSVPGAKVELDSMLTRSQAAQQMVLALLHKKRAADELLEKEGKTLVTRGLSNQELWHILDIEFPERPFPVWTDPQEKGAKGKPRSKPPGPPRPGHAVHSLKCVFISFSPLRLHCSLHLDFGLFGD